MKYLLLFLIFFCTACVEQQKVFSKPNYEPVPNEDVDTSDMILVPADQQQEEYEEVQPEYMPTEEERELFSPWYTDFKKAQALAKQHSRPLLVWVSDPREPNLDIEAEVFMDDTFELVCLVSLVKFKLEKHSDYIDELDKSLEVDKYPTVMILSPEGEEFERFTGYNEGDGRGYLKYLHRSLIQYRQHRIHETHRQQ